MSCVGLCLGLIARSTFDPAIFTFAANSFTPIARITFLHGGTHPWVLPSVRGGHGVAQQLVLVELGSSAHEHRDRGSATQWTRG